MKNSIAAAIFVLCLAVMVASSADARPEECRTYEVKVTCIGCHMENGQTAPPEDVVSRFGMVQRQDGEFFEEWVDCWEICYYDGMPYYLYTSFFDFYLYGTNLGSNARKVMGNEEWGYMGIYFTLNPRSLAGDALGYYGALLKFKGSYNPNCEGEGFPD